MEERAIAELRERLGDPLSTSPSAPQAARARRVALPASPPEDHKVIAPDEAP
jgi:hypothetical protein